LIFDVLAGALGAVGLNVLMPLDAAAFDAACAPVAPSLRLDALLPGARAALVVGSGGGAFFDAFRRAPMARDGRAHPLDRYTRAVTTAAVPAALAPLGIAHALYFPFTDAIPALPFQRLGRAAGLGAPGPLGLQIHPVYGPWWAYRALVTVSAPLPRRPPIGDGCAGCEAPCVGACPVGAVQCSGFRIPECHARRRAGGDCRLSCAARIACVRGPEQRYSDAQLAFHMAASLPRA
jgi:hypothetical protein